MEGGKRRNVDGTVKKWENVKERGEGREGERWKGSEVEG